MRKFNSKLKNSNKLIKNPRLIHRFFMAKEEPPILCEACGITLAVKQL